jgi:Icc-related predicted phosphoesterase
MKLVFISDTHNQHAKIKVPKGDFLIHAGDFTGRGHKYEVADFLDWFAAQPHKYKIFIAGNHDFLAEREPDVMKALIPKNVIYLNDSGVELEGIKFWGSPIQPWFYDWAFNRQRGADIRKHWDLIPAKTDVLITHGPPFGILDCVKRDGSMVGCQDLKKRIEDNPVKINVFGHIHEAYGFQKHDDVLFINASVLNEEYEMKNPPVVVEWGEKVEVV